MSVYVYRLVVTLPSEPPEDWHQIIYGYEPEMPSDPNESDPSFSWPSRRLYLSASGAAKRQKLLVRLGATVTVERSEAVMWPDDLPPDAVRPLPYDGPPCPNPCREPRLWSICLGCGRMVGVWENEDNCACDPALAGDQWVEGS